MVHNRQNEQKQADIIVKLLFLGGIIILFTSFYTAMTVLVGEAYQANGTSVMIGFTSGLLLLGVARIIEILNEMNQKSK